MDFMVTVAMILYLLIREINFKKFRCGCPKPTYTKMRNKNSNSKRDAKISIIIRTKNEEKYIEKTLSMLRNQTYKNQELIVVDSGSTDMTLEIAKKYVDKIVHIKPELFSYGRALNKGCEAATGKYLCFLSAHAIPTTNIYLQNFLDKINKSREIAAVFGRQVGGNTSRVYEISEFQINFPDSNSSTSPIICHNANVIIRKSVWNKFKYDEELTGLEDMEWGLRIKDTGYRIVYSSKAAVIHIHEETLSQIYIRAFREFYALKIFMPVYNFGIIDMIKEYGRKILIDIRNYNYKNPLDESIFTILLSRFFFSLGKYVGVR